MTEKLHDLLVADDIKYVHLAFVMIKGNPHLITKDIIPYLKIYPWMCLEYGILMEDYKKESSIYLTNSNNSCLPDRLFDLTNITELYLYHNQISELPKSLLKLHKLHKLSLSGNLIYDLPNWIIDLKYLKVLDISNNPLPDIPQVLFNNHNLTEIILPKGLRYSFHVHVIDKPSIRTKLEQIFKFT